MGAVFGFSVGAVERTARLHARSIMTHKRITLRGVVAKQTVVDPAKATSLSIGEFAWEIKQQAVGLPLSSESGPTDEPCAPE